MRYSRVLLVFPTFKSDLGSSRPSPSISYLAQSLEDHNIEYDVFDMKLGYKFDDLKRKIDDFKPDLIGITIFTLQHKAVYEMIAKMKSIYLELRVILGGPHIAIEKEKVMENRPEIDYACISEGEELIVQLCRGDEFSLIKGLLYRDGGVVKFTGVRQFEANIDKYGFPKLRKFELDKYANEILIISSRGCPYSCIFCSVHLVSGRKLRLRGIENVVDELEYWYNRGRRIFNILDDNFTFYEERVYNFCNEVQRRQLTDLILRASNGVRADKLNYNLLKRMKEVGFRSIGIGVEAGNNKILKNLRKGETIEEIELAIKNACDLGYEVALFFVFGTPGETLKDVEDSINIATKYPVFKIDFYNLIPFPGTELYTWVNENNAWIGNPEELLNKSDKNIRFGSCPFFETKELPLSMQLELNKRLFRVMRKGERKYLINVLRKKIGLFAYPLAYAISTKVVQNLYFNNNKIRKYAEKIRYSLLKQS